MASNYIPKGSAFGPFLRSFQSAYSLTANEIAPAIGMSRFTIKRIALGDTLPTERAYAEFCILFAAVMGKSFVSYNKLSSSYKSGVVNRIMSHGSEMSVEKIISLLSGTGAIVGLSKATALTSLSILAAPIRMATAIPVLTGLLFAGIIRPCFEESSYYDPYRNRIDPKFEIETNH